MIRRFIMGITFLASAVVPLSVVDQGQAAVQVAVTPTTLLPGQRVTVSVRVTGLLPYTHAEIAIFGPPPAMGPISLTNVTASNQGYTQASLSFSALEAGDYSASVTWSNSAGHASAKFQVRRLRSTNCPGYQTFPHVFSKGPELLIQGGLPKPGQSVWLLGIGYDPCSPVTLALAPPNADYGVVDPHVNTDRFGTFRIRLTIPRDWRADIMYVYPRVNSVQKPIAIIGIDRL